MKVIAIMMVSVLVFSCAKTEIIGMPEAHGLQDTLSTKVHRPPPKPPRDTTERQDTARVPIGWNPSVEDWEEVPAQ